ncbi:hypothetical protein FOZ60_000919 [Perkinsus olseni]|uniref:CCHC-type domain-containing protein n=1 Tax=Perkinsus olseni TaxID=32597 RepID=A0A7J6MW34_PEROL|nr:hypothetical protein FOZ60_000919 [Perkinsus olseni]
MPFKLETILEPFSGSEDFGLWLREFETVAEASRWSARQRGQYIVLFMKGSAKDIARQSLDEMEDEEDNDRRYAHVVRCLGQAFSLKTHEAWELLTTRKWKNQDTVDGMVAEFRRYLRVLAVTSPVASEILLREALMACLPVEVRKAIEVFEEDGRELSLNDIILKARSLLKKCGRGAENAAPLAAGGITSGKYCHNCKVVGHTAAECTRATGGQRQSRGRYRKPRGPLRCYNCQEQGHIARNCPRRRDQKDGQSGVAGEAKVSSAKSKPQGPLGGAAVEHSEERQGFVSAGRLPGEAVLRM